MRKLLFSFFVLFSVSAFSQPDDRPERPYNRPLIGTRLIPGHPLAEKMFGAWLFNERGGSRIYDSVSGASATTVDQTFMDSWNHQFGRGLLPEFTAATDREFILDDSNYNVPDITKGFTVVAFAYVDNWNQRRIISKSIVGTNAADHRWMLGIVTSSGNKARIRVRSGGTTRTLVGTRNLQLGQWIQFSLEYDQENIHITTIEEDGFFNRDETVAGGDLVSDGNPCHIGHQPGGDTTTNWDGQIEYIYLYNRYLSDEELKELHRDPYQMWQEPFLGRMLKIAAAAAAVDRRRFIISND